MKLCWQKHSVGSLKKKMRLFSAEPEVFQLGNQEESKSRNRAVDTTSFPGSRPV